MARIGLRNHPKFRRLVAMLRMPEAYVLGHLQMLWETAYELGDAIGDSTDVEVAAGWVGEPGVLCAALASCGGSGRSGFLEPDPSEGRQGCYLIHDLYDHAPDYVPRRVGKEIARRKGRPCEQCGTVFHSAEPHAKFCSPACRTAAYRLRHSDADVTECDAGARHKNAGVRDSDAPPSPSPSPSPITDSTESVEAPALADPTPKPPHPPKPPRKPARGPNSHLTEELQVDFWKAAKLVPPEKFVNPSLAAKAWSGIVASGAASGPELCGCLRRYVASFAPDRRCYMTQFHAWLEGSGFLAFLDAERSGAPDPDPLSRASPSGHRPSLSEDDQAYLNQLEAHG